MVFISLEKEEAVSQLIAQQPNLKTVNFPSVGSTKFYLILNRMSVKVFRFNPFRVQHLGHSSSEPHWLHEPQDSDWSSCILRPTTSSLGTLHSLKRIKTKPEVCVCEGVVSRCMCDVRGQSCDIRCTTTWIISMACSPSGVPLVLEFSHSWHCSGLWDRGTKVRQADWISANTQVIEEPQGSHL